MRLILLFIFFLFVSSASVSAQVVINELSSDTASDWVELYAQEDIDISGWILRDSASSVMKTIPPGVVLNAQSPVYVIEVGNRLNKSGDTVKLYKKDDATLIDKLSYGAEGGVCTPNPGGSIGRYPDANSTIERFSISTKNASNDEAGLDPCPTPTAEPAASHPPTLTPKPIKVPSTTKTLLPTDTPKPEVIALSASAADEEGPDITGTNSEYEKEPDVKALQNRTDSPTPMVKGDAKDALPVFPLVFISLGLLFIAGAIYPLLRKLKKSYNFEDEDTKKID